MVAPSTPDEWRKISKGFEERWNFPNCCGAIDGKHVVIQCPALSGSTFFNYKHTFSINLMAACDSNYCFTMLDVGSPGRNSDGGVFASSGFGRALEGGCLQLPAPRRLPGGEEEVPYVFTADEAFPLQHHIMRPYPGRHLEEKKAIFNYRLSRARRTIENTFGILAARWRVFRRPIHANIPKVISIVKATCVLHNWLKGADQRVPGESRHYCPQNFTDAESENGTTAPGGWRDEVTEADGMREIQHLGSNNYSLISATIRESFCEYFVSPDGEVPWQYAHVRRGFTSQTPANTL
ncbi:protein ALP1-like [Patiria miniata]|uniref:DDE Tnp4 domain-containing protein n=1 Tax=Patiria miniata TaxID=46514 RepID=A0A913ZZK8_PATMI|nr:protein ALP1-like [Patiria miniata]